MKALGAEIGGEGNGGVIFPRVHFGRDSATGVGLILSLLAARREAAPGVRFSEINAAIPDYAMVKDKIDLPQAAAAGPALRKLKAGLKDLARRRGEKPATDEQDGLKIILPDRWLHMRASGTEPIMRLFAEAPDAKGCRELIAWARETIGD
jgi:phosphomannomutase